MPFAELSTGARLYYDDSDPTNADNKPVVIAVHGMLGTAAMHLANITAWLSTEYRVIGPTLRGYGQSEPKPRRFPADFYQQDTRDVLALMDALAINKAHILGYSDGGEIALLAGCNAPERFASVVAWGAVGYFGPAMRPVAQRYYPGDWITQEERQTHGITDVNAFVLGWIQSVRSIIDGGGDLSLSQADRMTSPLLLMLGENDRLNPIEYGQRFVDRTPDGRLVTFPCGHGIHNEVWEAFQGVVGPFLAQNSMT